MATLPMFQMTHGEAVFVLEPTRRGSKKLNCSSMPVGPGPQVRVLYRSVPLAVRRAAREFMVARNYGKTETA